VVAAFMKTRGMWLRIETGAIFVGIPRSKAVIRTMREVAVAIVVFLVMAAAAQSQTITGLSPASGAAGTSVTISGLNFGSAQGNSSIFFGATPATPTSWSSTQIVAPVPSAATTGNVVVLVGGTGSNGVPFTVLPTITSLSQTNAPVGSSVSINGSGFGNSQGTSTVTFNGTVATPTNWATTQIVVPVPTGTTAGNLVVTVGGNSSNAVTFTVTPGISGLSVSSGSVGTSVTITGTSFGSLQGTSTVTFNGALATPTSWNNSQIVAPVPAAATTGNVVVTEGGNASNGVSFSVNPVIGSLSPTSGPAGTTVTITGTGFGNTSGTVAFNGAVATPTSWSSTQIVVPARGATAPVTQNVTVKLGGNISNAVGFTVTPSISSVSPTAGSFGTSVTISGSAFGTSQGSGTVTFNGISATPAHWGGGSGNQIVVPVPSGATTGNLVVTSSGYASNPMPFSVVGISNVSPAVGSPGTSVTITGTGFGASQGSSSFFFNLGIPASPTSWSSTQIVVPVPSAATTGNLVVLVGGTDSNVVAFTVLPSITGLSQISAPVGRSVTINGGGFGNSQGTSAITFNGMAGTPSNWAATQIVVPVPSGATNGNVVVTVGGNASNGVPFTIAPGIASFSPTSGPVGTAVAISGTSFGGSQGTSTVIFNGTAAPVLSWSNSSIVAQVPAGATTGNVTVTVGGNTGSNGTNFTVTASPVVQSNSGFGVAVASTSVPFLSANTAGNVLWVAVGGGGTITVPSDALGNIYTLATSVNGGSGSAAIYYAVSAQTGTNTVTCNQSGGADLHCHIAEITGLVPASALDQTGSVVSAETCLVSTSAATVKPGEWVGAFFYDGTSDPALTGGTGYSTVQLSANGSGDAGLSESEISGSAGVLTATCGGNSSVALAQLITTFQTLADTPTPTISGLSATSAPVGISLTISGSNFGSAQRSSTVTFSNGLANGVTATPSSWSDTQIMVPVPGTAVSGNLIITVDGLNSNSIALTVPPVISDISPVAAPAGAIVTINGSGFGPALVQGCCTVSFNGIAAIPSFWSATQIVVQVPNGSSSGNVIVTVDGVGSNETSFVVSPEISVLGPTSGPVGNSITLLGSNFGASQGTSTVTFNGVVATPTNWNTTQIVVPVPAAATTGNVVVTVGGNASNGVSFAVVPSIAGISPSSAAVGTSVTINGTGFEPTQGSSAVTFNGVAATPASWSDTQIVVPVPAAATTGFVVVTVNGTASIGLAFSVTPTISNISLTGGVAGTSVTITGTGFGAAQGINGVSFNGVTATPTSWSATQIVVPVPVAATSGNVMVTVNGAASNGVAFTVIPTISVSPTNGPVGTSVTIGSTTFGSGPSATTVTFNGVTATPAAWSATEIVVQVPAGATSGNVVVTVNGTASIGVPFTVLPAITGLSPIAAPTGVPVTITGTTFGASQGTSTLTFNGVTATPASWSATQIVAPVPAAAISGNVVVTVSGNASNGATFAVTPAIGSLSPTSGLVGTSVTITGTTFGTSQGTSTVSFSGAAATATSWSNTQIVVMVPSGATTGNVVVTVGGLVSSGVSFTVIPEISSLSPTSGTAGPVGASVTITGTGFGSSQSNSTVTFNGATATPSLWSNTQIVVTVPSNATTGNVVVTVGGVASNGMLFAVIPTISNVSPTSGAVGTAVIVSGYGFGSGQGTSTVTFNGASATPTSWSDNQIAVTVLSGTTSGNVVVTVGGLASNGVNFNVVAPPSIKGLSANSGPAGAQVAITGTGFGASQGNGIVTFNRTPGNVISWSDTQIVVQVAAGTATGNVVVTAAGGVPSPGVPFVVNQAAFINNINPNSGPVGAQVTMSGVFGDAQGTVTFTTSNGTVNAQVTSWNAATIVVTVPAAAISGNVVAVNAGGASNGVPFTVVPTTTGIQPPAAIVGAAITITGTGFGDAKGTSTVAFGDTLSGPVTNWSNSSIMVSVPNVPVGVTNVVVRVGGQASNPQQVTVVPTVTGLSLQLGPPGMGFVVSGFDFGDDSLGSTVTIGAVQLTPTQWADQSITVQIPQNAPSVGGIVVVTVGGQASQVAQGANANFNILPLFGCGLAQ